MIVAAYAGGLVVLGAAGAWALGRLAARVFSVRNVVVRGLLILGVVILAVLICIGPVFALTFTFFDDLPLEDLLNHLPPRSLPTSWVIYMAILYLSFRLGLGKLGGTG